MRYEIRELAFDSWDDNEGVVYSPPIVAVIKSHVGNEHMIRLTVLVELED